MKPSFELEFALDKQFQKNGAKKSKANIAGIDEVGCGPWAGPVVACAFVFHNYDTPVIKHVNDSKQLSPGKRQSVYDYCVRTKGRMVDFAIGIASVQEIDSLNLKGAVSLAMKRAVNGLPIMPEFLLIDGVRNPQFVDNITVKMIAKGDEISFSIAAASIIAKVHRDNLMKQLDQEYPQYGWGNNFGYGTAFHSKAINDFGITAHHRQSYAPIKRYLESQN